MASDEMIKKERTGFEFPIELMDELNETCHKLKRELKGERRITKTLIIEKAIRFALNDAATKGEDSAFYKSLLQNDISLEQAIDRAMKQECNKEKTTFNLSTDILEALAQSWFRVSRELKDEKRITKTLLVEAGIVMILNDLNKGENSEFLETLKTNSTP